MAGVACWPLEVELLLAIVLGAALEAALGAAALDEVDVAGLAVSPPPHTRRPRSAA